jgi:hypothetical protein
MTRNNVLLALIVALLCSGELYAQDEPSTTVNGFVDVYYAHSFLSHPMRDRSFTTQPLKHNEFNLNLGAIDVKFQGERVRGRVALQTGTYVQANFATEPQLLKHVLEASAGTRFGENVWVDIGIFPSHIGFEGILSRDNWTYSRSLLADYSPYYEAGVSITASVSEKVSLRGLVLNGWQNINETNDDKAVGSQVQYKPSGSVLLNWSTFIGNEQPDTVASRLRLFNDFYAVFTLSDSWSLAAVFDVGFQKQASGGAYDSWHAATLMVKHTINQHWAVAARGEYFSDKNGVIIPTGTPNNFQTTGGSINVDYAASSNLLWRLEGRLFNSKDPLYPSGGELKKTDGFMVLSAAISL